MVTLRPPLLLQLMITMTVLVQLSGCQRASEESVVSTAGDLTDYADLPLVRKTHHQELRKEVARLISEQATPALLTRGLDSGGKPLAATDVDPQPNFAAALEEVFPVKQRRSLEDRLARIYPLDRFEFSRTKLRGALSLNDELAAQRERYRGLATNSNDGFRLDHTRGLAIDASFVDAVQLGNRLEALHAAGLLDQGQPQLALESLDVLLRMAQLLAREPHLVPRTAAVHLRGEALRVLEAIADHPYSTAETQQQLLLRIEQQLADWTQDSDAWLGERAQGLHTYELIRDGYLLSLLDHDEIQGYRDEYGDDQFGPKVLSNIDADEMFYLTSMRRVIESCEQPYFERQAVFRRIERQLGALRETMSYPFVADQLLLRELEQGHRWQALDTARCLAWQLALGTAIGHEPYEVPVNPITGFRFILEIRPDKVIVDAIDPQREERPVVVRRIRAARGETE